MVTPSHTKAWLWTLQSRPIRAPRCTSTKVPIRVLSPMLQPYRLVNENTVTFSPNSTSSISRKGASFAGWEGTGANYRGVDMIDCPAR